MKTHWATFLRMAPTLLGGIALLAAPACSPDSSLEAPPAQQERAPTAPDLDEENSAAETGEESIQPRYGGVLAELGDGEAHVEFVLEPEAGWVSVYILDSNAQDRVRLKEEQIGVIFTMHGEDIPAEERTFSRALEPVENASRGETAGDAAHFEVKHELFQGAEGFDAVIPTLTIQDTEYTNVSVQYHTEQD